jgi:hypothetical protein
MSEIQTAFQGEMQLAGWSETHNGGCKVTFWLPDAAELEAFRALTVRKGSTAGHRFMAALVEIGDDELPVQQMEPEKPKGGLLAELTGRFRNDPKFWAWCRHTYGWRCESTEDAAAIIRLTCRVESCAELDHNRDAEAIFHREIRTPFSKWLQFGQKSGGAS